MSASANGTTAPAPLSAIDQLANKIADLEKRLQTAAPGYEGLLHSIHTELQKDDALANLLSPEQVGVVVAGLSKRKGVVIANTDKLGKGNITAGGKKLKDLGVDDLI